MLKFQDYIQLQEALITFGNKAYPKFGNVVIMAGGAGSGKGFVLSKLVGIEGKLFDVDELKLLAVKSNKFAERIKNETGNDIKNFNFKNPDEVSKLHTILSDIYDLPNKSKQTTYSSILLQDPSRKPNLIFDVTLKDISKLDEISRSANELGYDKENIHIIWVINEVDVALKQNELRARKVNPDILISTHEGAALTMKKILDMGDRLKNYLNGDIWLVFNKAEVKDVNGNVINAGDTKLKKSPNGGSYVVEKTYYKIKAAGKPSITTAQLDKNIYDKIMNYVPKNSYW